MKQVEQLNTPLLGEENMNGPEVSRAHLGRGP